LPDTGWHRADPRWADPRTLAVLPGRPAEAAADEPLPVPPQPSAPGRSTSTRSWQRGAALAVIGIVLGGLLQAPVRDLLGGSPPASVADSQPAQAPPAATLPPTGTAPAPTPAQGASGLDPAKIAAAVDPGVVDVNTRTAQGSSAGTGMVLTATGRVLTNNHVIDGATSILVTVTSTGRQYTARVVGTDRTDDVAVLQMTGASGLTTVPLGTTAPVAVGDPIAALGNAGGRGGTPALTTGVVTALDRPVTTSDPVTGTTSRLTGLIETNASLQPGDSGGPLVNAQAKVIGMDTAASVSRQLDATGSSEGYAIPIARALAIAQQIVAGHASSTIHLGVPGLLGVRLAPTANAGGVVVGSADSTLPAARAGIAAGDVITAVDGVAVHTPDQLVTLIGKHRAGQTAVVRWVTANGTAHTATVTLAAGAAD
jgi:S1-C subfamily serine protease